MKELTQIQCITRSLSHISGVSKRKAKTEMDQNSKRARPSMSDGSTPLADLISDFFLAFVVFEPLALLS